MSKRILIIGGMGPQASLVLHNYLIDAAVKLGVRDNQDYPLIVHASIPVEDFISDQSAKPRALALLRQTLQPLQQFGFTDAVIACNTAHLLYDEIADAAGIRPHSLVQLAEQERRQMGSPVTGVLATPTTLQSGLYRDVLTLDADGQQTTLNYILSVLASDTPDPTALGRLTGKLHKQGAEVVILGCTELSVINQPAIANPRVIDPLRLAAKQIMGIAV
jgi:aspartate racemase